MYILVTFKDFALIFSYLKSKIYALIYGLNVFLKNNNKIIFYFNL
jgi:hypothetical protein